MQLPRLREPFDLTGKVAVVTGSPSGLGLERAWMAMLGGTGQSFILESARGAIWHGRVIRLALLGFNMPGDALRDKLSLRLRGHR